MLGCSEHQGELKPGRDELKQEQGSRSGSLTFRLWMSKFFSQSAGPVLPQQRPCPFSYQTPDHTFYFGEIRTSILIGQKTHKVLDVVHESVLAVVGLSIILDDEIHLLIQLAFNLIT